MKVNILSEESLGMMSFKGLFIKYRRYFNGVRDLKD